MRQVPVYSRSLVVKIWLALWLIIPVSLQAAPPDLTGSGVIAGIDRTSTYNLGATGIRGWIWVDRNNKGEVGLITDQCRQILVTHCVAPASAVLAVDDVILGAMAANSGTVPAFSSDCRKAFATAIADAEKTGAGTLRVKRWRAGVITDHNISLTILGNYSATAPFSCPKSTLILDGVRNKMVADLLADPNYLNGQFGGACNALALLAGVKPGDPNYSAVQTRLQSFARSLASAGPVNDGLPIWGWSYSLIYLSEYYLITGDSQVVPGIQSFTLKLAQSQSIYGTYGHGPAMTRPDGSGRLVSTGYGPVNAAGGTAAIALVMGKKALVAAGQSVDPQIDAAIQRSSGFFSFFVNKGGIPYGEHEPVVTYHASNGKDAMPAVFFGLQTGRAAETEYFSRISIAGWIGREYGHTGQGLSYFWATLGALMGGPNAASEHLKQIRWHLDLLRRTDGSFAYDGQEQYGPGTTAGNTYLGAADYGGMTANAMYLLTYSLPLQRLWITGKSANPAYTLDSTKIASAVSAGSFRLVRGTKSISELFTAIGDYDPIVRNYASIELASRTLSGTELTNLRGLLSSTDPNLRQSACQTLGLRQDSTALPTIVTRLNDSDIWVRAKAAIAIRAYSSAAAGTHRDSMMTSFIANATNPDVINWTDPLQMGNGKLSMAIFGHGVGDGTPGNDIAAYTINASKQTLLYPALRAGLKQPDSYVRAGVTQFCRERLPLVDVQAVYPEAASAAEYDTPADRMWSGDCRRNAITMLAALKIAEGIPLALVMLDSAPGFEWGEGNPRIGALDALASYGDAARYTLPTLKVYLNQWNPLAEEYPVLVSTIDAIENAISAPAQNPGLCVANSQAVTTTGTKAITLSGASPRGAFSYLNVTQPAHGTITGTAPNLTYTPTGGYTGPDKFTFQTSDTLTTSTVATVGIVVGSSGNGLKGEYFDNANFSNLVLTRTDAQVNFDWGTGTPHATVGVDTFSVRWGGQLLVPETGTYTFSTLSSEGTRLYINGVPVIDNFLDQSTKWVDGTPIQLTAGQMVEIQMEYYENTGSAVAKLKWTGPSIAGQNGAIIPQIYLFDGTGISNRMPYASAQSVSMLQNTSQGITLTGSGGSLTFTVLTQPSHGSLTGTAPYLTYTPTTNYTGSDSFTFLVNNGNGNSAPATVSFSISANLPATYTWKNPANGNLSLATNWTSGTAPAAAGQNYYNLNFAPSGTYTVSHNLNNGFQLNQLNVSGNSTFSGTNSLSFVANGSILPQFNQNSTNAVTVNTPLNLATMTTLGGNGGGQITLTNLISGSGGLIKNSPSILRIENFNNTYSGGTVLNVGTTTFPDGDGNVTACLGMGPVTLNPSATLNLDRINLPNAILLNGGKITGGNSYTSYFTGPVTLTGITTFDFGSTGNLEISGNIIGSGGLTTVGTASWSLSGTNSYSGPTTIQAGKLNYHTVGAVSPGALNIHTGGKANLNYSGNRIIASLTLGGIEMPAGSYGSTSSSATYKNDNYFFGTGTGTVIVLPATTTSLSLSSGSSPANVGTSLTFTATVTGSSPTGNVAFYAGSTLLGTSALNGSYQASFTTSSLVTGSHNITAKYAGNPTHGASTSNTLAIDITTNLPAVPTNLLAVSGNNQIGLTWTFSSGATGYHVKRSLINGGPYTTIANPTTAGYNDLTAVNGTTYFYVISAFNGNGESANSQQVAVIRSIQPSTSMILSAPLGSGVSGTSVTFTATVSGVGVTPSGTVTFKDGATVLGTNSLNSGTAVFTTSALALGNHLITANYAGDANYLSSVSSPCAYLVTTQVPTTTTVINLGATTAGAGTAFSAGLLYPKIATGILPPGSILKGVAWNVTLTGGDPYLGNLAVYFADSDGTNPVLQVGGVGSPGSPVDDPPPPFTAPIKLPWNAGSAYAIGTTASTSLTAVDGVPAFDLNSKTVFLETGYPGAWGGTITLTHDNAALYAATPVNLLATSGVNQIGLTWAASAGASGYYVKRALVAGGPYTVIGSSVSASYIDLTANVGVTNYYVVSAFNNYGESANSSQKSATAFSSLSDAWANSTFTNGILSNKTMKFDFDGGGLDTGIEWVVGSDPTVGSDDVSKAPIMDNTSDPTYFIYSYRRTDAANTDTKTTIVVEYSSDLSAWTPAVAGANIIITTSDNFYGSSPGIDKVEVKIKRTIATSGKIFSRLKVVVAP